MNYSLRAFGIGLLLLATGCQDTKWAFLRSSRDTPPVAGDRPTEAKLVAYLNYNADRIQSLQVNELELEGRQGLQAIPGLDGWLMCRKPGDFRMRADVAAVGKTMVDIGSNDQEFWYWIAKNNPPYLVHCSYTDLRSGTVKLPFPFQPQWVMETLGMGHYDPAGAYQLVEKGKTYRLTQEATGSQGQRVRKTIVFNRDGGNYPVLEHILEDAQGKELCTAHIYNAQYLPAAGVTVPHQVSLRWKEQNLELTLKLNKVTVNQEFNQERAVSLFTRPTMNGVQSFDLARGLDSGYGGQISPAGGFGMR
jgi:hypothetical protein